MSIFDLVHQGEEKRDFYRNRAAREDLTRKNEESHARLVQERNQKDDERERERKEQAEEKEALAFFRRMPLDRCAVKKSEIIKAIGNPMQLRWDDRGIEDLHTFVLNETFIFDDGIAFPTVERIAKELRYVEKRRYGPIRLEHAQLAEVIYASLVTFNVKNDPEISLDEQAGTTGPR